MKKRPLLVVSAAFLAITISVNVGYGAWMIYTTKYEGSASIEASINNKPVSVAKVVGTSGTTYFTDIGRALKYAYESSEEESIYLIPNLDNDKESLSWSKTQVTLTSKYAADSSYSYDGKTYAQYIVSSNDTLLLPYTEETIFTEYQNGYGFIDSSIGSQQNNMKNELIIDEGVLLDIQGNLKIGGVMGGQSGTPDLQNTVQGNYAQISMKQNSKIVYRGSSSENNVYGYIKEYDENAKSDGIDVVSGAKFIMPLTCYDWTGGTWAVSILSSYFPILVYDFPNVQTKIRAYYGGTIGALADVAISGEHFQADVNVISTSSDYFLQMTGEGYVEFDWEPRSTVTTTTDGEERTIALTEDDGSSATYGNSTKEKVTIASNVTMNNLEVSVSSYDMTTADKEIPLSYKIDITVKDGSTYTIPSSLSAKFLPGSRVEVEEGATINLQGGVIAYKNFNEKIRDGSALYTTKFNVENGGPGAEIINNGTINIYGGASFGGLIKTTNTSGTARTVFAEGCNYSQTVKEGASYSKLGLYIVTYEDSTLSATGNIYADGSYSDEASFEGKGTNFVSTNVEDGLNANYWMEKISEDITLVSIVSKDSSGNSSTATGEGKSGTFTLSLSFTPQAHKSTITGYQWTIASGLTSNSSLTGNSITVTVPKNSSTTADNTYDVGCTVTFTTSEGLANQTVTGGITLTGTKGSCLLPTTLITMADGSYRMVKDIEAGDYILAFNHETGKIEPSMVLFNDHEEEALMSVLYLDFSGKEVGVIYEHGFFDMTLNKYIYLTTDNYMDYIGHEFAYMDENGNISSRLLSGAYIKEEVTECYSPVTYSTLNYFTEDLLSMPGGISGLFNYFDHDPETLAYDQEKKEKDIEEYGLFSYGDFASTGLTEEAFNAYNGQYLKVALAKGLITYERIECLIERYSKYF